jgi:hypothetical protein
MRRLFLIVFSALLSLFTAAQEQNQVVFSVLNSESKPVQSASVELLAGDKLVKIQMTDAEGKVIFNGLQPGMYSVRVSSAGMTSFHSEPFKFDSISSFTHPAIILQPLNKTLESVTITARKPFIELKPGKTIVNVDAGITNVGATAMEALEKMPGLTVDKDGNIFINGKAGVTVLIDGKQTYLDATQLATLLNGMNASQISQVEIMSQPGAQYDAAGNAGIVNIKTKKNLQKGLNGSFTTSYGQGVYPKTNNSLQTNYRNGKWNLFANYNNNLNTQYMYIYAFRTYFRPDGSAASFLEQPSFFKSNIKIHNVKTGADYALTKNSSVGITLTGVAINRHGGSDNSATWLNDQRREDSLVKTQSFANATWKNYSGNLNFRHSFSAKKELTADLDVLSYSIRRSERFENTVVSPIVYTDATRAGTPSDIDIVSGKLDYSHELQQLKWAAGVKASKVTTDNLSQNEIRNGASWEMDYNRSNHFLYNENIKAAYMNAETKQEKWTFQGGLRYEMTSYDANQLGNILQKDSSFSRSYNSFFPTAFVSFAADSNNSFSLSAGRRIDRPPFQKLNPFIITINKYTYQKGNPFFRPQYTWNYELGHVYKNILSSSIGYSVTTDYFSQIFPRDTGGIIIYTEGNLGRLQHFTVTSGVQLSPLKWWSLSTQAVFVHKKMEGVIDRKLQATVNQVTINMNNQFRFKKGWSGEISGVYVSSSQNDIQEFLDPAGQLNVGLGKTVLNNKGTIRLSVRDLFHTQWMKGNTYFSQAHEYFKLTRDTRVAAISFNYRFGKTFKTTKRSEGASEEEKQRVGNG